jgi:hypothetical protein
VTKARNILGVKIEKNRVLGVLRETHILKIGSITIGQYTCSFFYDVLFEFLEGKVLRVGSRQDDKRVKAMNESSNIWRFGEIEMETKINRLLDKGSST